RSCVFHSISRIGLSINDGISRLSGNATWCKSMMGGLKTGTQAVYGRWEIVEVKLHTDIPDAGTQAEVIILLRKAGAEVVVIINGGQVEKEFVVENMIPTQRHGAVTIR